MATLVLLPGMDGTGRLFAGLLAALPRTVSDGTDGLGRRGAEGGLGARGPATSLVVAYPPDEPLGYEALETLVRAQLPTDSPFVLLAESFSGPVAVRIAASAPRGLRGVILCCSFVRSPSVMPRVLRPLASLVPVAAVPRGLVARALLGRFASPQLRRDLARAVDAVSPETFRARLAAIRGVDASSDLARIRVPVLCLRATEDRVVPRTASRTIAARLPGLRIVDLEGPHLLLQAAPEAAAREIAAFVREVAPAG